MGYLCKDHLFVLFVILTLIDVVGGAAAWQNRAKIGMALAACFVPADLYVLYTIMEMPQQDMDCSYTAGNSSVATLPLALGGSAVPAVVASPQASKIPSVAVQGRVVDLGSATAIS